MIGLVFRFSLLYLISFSTIQNVLSNSTVTETLQNSIITTSPAEQCAPEKSLHSKEDIQLLIDNIYNATSIDSVIVENYLSKATALRDKHFKELSHFIEWFGNQPKHLKHVLNRLTKLRKHEVEPEAKRISTILSEHPQLEKTYWKKSNRTNELLKKLKRYELLCHYNCDEFFSVQPKEHNIFKRNTINGLYCSSLQDLQNEITKRLSDIVKNLNNDTNSKLAMDDKIYQEKIDQIKSKLKDKELKKFGRTMYDILSLEDEYHHYIEDITSRDVIVAVYAIKNLALHIDAKLLLLEQAIERVGYHCKSCDSDILVRNVRSADKISKQKNTEPKFSNIIDELIEVKSKAIFAEVEDDLTNIFNNLNFLINKLETEDPHLQNLQSIQEEVNLMTTAEKDALYRLQNDASLTSMNKIRRLIKKFQDLFKLIQNVLDKISS